jgi:hypothetical protein
MIFENLNWDTFEKFGKNPSDSSTWFKEIAKKYRTYFVCSQIWLYLFHRWLPLWLHDQTVKKETPMPNFNTVVTLAALTLIISLVEMLNLQKLEISKNNFKKKRKIESIFWNILVFNIEFSKLIDYWTDMSWSCPCT